MCHKPRRWIAERSTTSPAANFDITPPSTKNLVTDSFHSVARNLRIVSLCTLASRVLGLLRDQAMGACFGAGPLLDAFTVAFRLPNLARVLLGEGALTTAFLPTFVSELNEHGKEAAARTTWAVFMALALVLGGGVVTGEFLLWLAGRCFSLSPTAELLRELTALLLPYVILICLAAQLGAALNGIGRFLWVALVPVVLNLVWLSVLWGLIPRWVDPEQQIRIVAVCVVIAGCLQLLLPLVALHRFGFGYRSDWRLAWDRVGSTSRAMLPVVIGLSISQLNTILDSLVAWGFAKPAESATMTWWPGSPEYPLATGAATSLYLGQRLYQFPLGVFGVALGTVLFPRLAAHAAKGDMSALRDDVSLGARLVLAIGIPASMGLILVAHPLATLFFQYGKFEAEAARQTGDMIACYGAGVWAYCGLLILQRGFYAVGDRLTPMYVGLGMIGLNLALNLNLVWPLGAQGLALSTTLVASIQCLLTGALLQRRIGSIHWSPILTTLFKTLLATAVMTGVCLLCQQVTWGRMVSAHERAILARAVTLMMPLAASLLTYFVVAKLIGLAEPWQLVMPSQRPQMSTDVTNDPIEI